MRDIELIELICNRFVLAQEATGLRKGEFAKAVGLTPQQFTNISRYRNPPSPKAITLACEQFGFTTDFFYRGERPGFRDPALPMKLRGAQRKLGLAG